MAQMIRVEFESRLGARDCHRSLRQASEIAPFLSEWAPHLLDEVKGVADGAGIDLRAALWMQWGMAVPGRKKDECTAFAVGPEYTGDGSVYAGQNKDTGVGANERSIVLCVHPAGFPSILSFSYPGLLAEIGLSSMGVSLWGMSLYVDGNRGGGNPMLKRMLLECGTVHEMRELATAIGGESVGAYAVSDADGNVGVMELLPERQVWIDGG
ncbi:MAG: C45 family autoproteolytic acyltransferase/hydrolase, partial [Dehalococcoidia bacterium]|nr:C45 family autoproteolytic acyltransferase/hydrolase [Dehalococcoidia bacterium]